MGKWHRYNRWTLSIPCPQPGCPALEGQECKVSVNETFTLPYPHRLREYYGRMQRLKAEKEALENDPSEMDS
jgi:hypothetical protein